MTVGFPDYWKGSSPQRATLGEGQAVWAVEFDEDVPAGSTSTVTLYTIPAGYRLYFSDGAIACNASLIQRFDMIVVGVWLYAVYFDINYLLVDSSLGTTVLPATLVLQIKFYYYDSVERKFVGAVWGILEKA